MRTHQVEVDDEVFAFVKSHAEPLVDTFNTSLRRLLLKKSEQPTRTNAPQAAAGGPAFPGGTPQALRQIIEVAFLVIGGAYTRQSATQAVAKRYQVATQTVLDKYCRQLGLTANQFDRLLEQSGRKELKQLLRTKFPGHGEVIDRNLQ